MLIDESSKGGTTMLELEVVPEHGLQGEAIEFLLGETIATTTLALALALGPGPVRHPTATSSIVSSAAALDMII